MTLSGSPNIKYMKSKTKTMKIEDNKVICDMIATGCKYFKCLTTAKTKKKAKLSCFIEKNNYIQFITEQFKNIIKCNKIK